MVYEFTIQGKPIAKKRPRFARRGKFVKTYNCQETEEGRFLFDLQQQAGHLQKLIEGPIELFLLFTFDRPKAHFTSKGALKPSAPKWHIKKPDIDNCEKFVCDCLNGSVWKDDSQVVRIVSEKRYGGPMTKIKIVEL